MRRTNCRAFIRASIKQKLFIRILTREPICRSGRSLIIYLLLLSLLLPSRSMRPSAIISASLSSAIVIHRPFGIVKSRDVTPYNEKFAIPPAKYIVTRRNKSIGRREGDGWEGQTAGANIIRSQLKSSIIDLFRRRLTALTGLTTILRPNCKKQVYTKPERGPDQAAYVACLRVFSTFC